MKPVLRLKFLRTGRDEISRGAGVNLEGRSDRALEHDGRTSDATGFAEVRAVGRIVANDDLKLGIDESPVGKIRTLRRSF